MNVSVVKGMMSLYKTQNVLLATLFMNAEKEA